MAVEVTVMTTDRIVLRSCATLFATILIFGSKLATIHAKGKFDVVYSWKIIDYVWPDPESQEEAVENGNYIPENNAISGVKIWADRVYLSVPRWLPGVPFTLNWVPWVPPSGGKDGDQNETPSSPSLTPFPCTEIQKSGNCCAIQYVHGFEIDPLGRMWVLDVGRKNILTSDPDNECSPKILILDLKEGGKVLRLHIFPEDVASRNDSFLNDLVVDVNGSPDGSDWFAYISNSGGTPEGGGSIVVYDLKNDESWKVVHPSSMSFDRSAAKARVGGREAILKYNVDGIALTPAGTKERLLFYCPLGTYNLYSIPTRVLRTEKNKNVARFVRNLGRKRSQADGMMMDNKGRLFYGALTQDAVMRVDRRDLIRSNGRRINEKLIVQDHKRLQWVDGLGFDNSNQLWFITNRLQNVQAGAVNTSEINYRLIRLSPNATSYMYPGSSSRSLTVMESPDTSPAASSFLLDFIRQSDEPENVDL